jgi:hypothetical protein
MPTLPAGCCRRAPFIRCRRCSLPDPGRRYRASDPTHRLRTTLANEEPYGIRGPPFSRPCPRQLPNSGRLDSILYCRELELGGVSSCSKARRACDAHVVGSARGCRSRRRSPSDLLATAQNRQPRPRAPNERTQAVSHRVGGISVTSQLCSNEYFPPHLTNEEVVD